MFTTGKKPVDLANQMLIDCCSKCSGHPDHSFDWIRDNGGMDTSASYGPYKGNKGTCKHSKATVGQEIESWAIVKPESAFMAALNDGPYHVAIDCGSLRSYKKGVLTNAQCKSPGDHDVLLVGAGEAEGKQYWRIKNSWGTSFGEAGYFRVRRDHKEMCLGEPNSFGSPASVVVGKKVVVLISNSLGLFETLGRRRCVFSSSTPTLPFGTGERVHPSTDSSVGLMAQYRQPLCRFPI